MKTFLASKMDSAQDILTRVAGDHDVVSRAEAYGVGYGVAHEVVQSSIITTSLIYFRICQGFPPSSEDLPGSRTDFMIRFGQATHG